MRSTSRSYTSENLEKGLVTLSPGKYPVVGTSGKSFVIQTPTHAMAIEHVGTHVDQTSCWHVLVENSVLLVWENDMVMG